MSFGFELLGYYGLGLVIGAIFLLGFRVISWIRHRHDIDLEVSNAATLYRGCHLYLNPGTGDEEGPFEIVSIARDGLSCTLKPAPRGRR